MCVYSSSPRIILIGQTQASIFIQNLSIIMLFFSFFLFFLRISVSTVPKSLRWVKYLVNRSRFVLGTFLGYRQTVSLLIMVLLLTILEDGKYLFINHYDCHESDKLVHIHEVKLMKLIILFTQIPFAYSLTGPWWLILKDKPISGSKILKKKTNSQ